MNKTYKLGDLIQECDERNTFGIPDFYGINIEKEFMPTVANTEGLDETKYKVVRKNRFVFSGMQTGRDNCIRVSMYKKDEPIIVSPAYTTFEVKQTDIILPTYLFMFFCSKEKDRFGAFLSDGSIRSNLDWSVFCSMKITLPPLDVQQKYVDIYNAMQKNAASFEQGADDLKLVCDGFIEKLKNTCHSDEKKRNSDKENCHSELVSESHEEMLKQVQHDENTKALHDSDECRMVKIGEFIEESSVKNTDKKIAKVMGLSTQKTYREPNSRVNKDELANYKIVKKDWFSYVPTTDTWKVFAFGLNTFDEDIVVSPIYEVFYIPDTSKLLPEYLSMFFTRTEFDRYARFHSWGSARETFTFDDLCQVQIPLPPLSVQKSIVQIYNVYNKRKSIATTLKTQIKQLCPVLIKGSLQGE